MEESKNNNTHPLHHEFLHLCFHDLAKAEVMLRENPELISSRDGVGETALHYLVVEDCLEGVKFLLRNGADVNCQDKFGGTPLAHASQLGHEYLVHLLLENGAKTDTESEIGETALIDAARSGQVGSIQQLMAAGADPNQVDNMGQTALHAAAAFGQLETVKALINNGCSVTATDVGGLTPLHYATMAGNIAVAGHLISKGADVNARSCFGPPLFMLQNGDMEFVRLLMSHGAQLEGVNDRQRTMLHGVAYGGLRDVVEFLLEQGFNPLAKDDTGATTIDEAIRGGHPEIAKLIQKWIDR